MVASTKVRCVVVSVPVARHEEIERPTVKPSELLPWADPYIASLVHKLQAEVREERAAARIEREAMTRWDDADEITVTTESAEFLGELAEELATAGV